MMVTKSTCLLLGDPSASDDDYINRHFEPRKKHLLKEIRPGSSSTHNCFWRGHNIMVKIYIMTNFTLKAMRGCSIYNTITKQFREEILEWVISYPNVKLLCVLSDVVNFLTQD